MNKKIVSLTLGLGLAVTLGACQGGGDTPATTSPAPAGGASPAPKATTAPAPAPAKTPAATPTKSP